MRALITFGATHPEKSVGVLEEAANEEPTVIDKDTLVAMIEDASDVQVIEVELLD